MATWAHDFQTAYGELCAALDRGESVNIDEYAGRKPAEFFAVMSEAFFLVPLVVQSDFPASTDNSPPSIVRIRSHC